MGEYVININWSGGSKRKTNPYAFLAGAGIKHILDENSVKPDTLSGINSIQDEEGEETTKQWKIIQQGVVLKHVDRFFWSKTGIGTRTGEAYGDFKSFKDIPATKWEWDKGEVKLVNKTVHKRTIAYTAAQAIRLINLGVSTHYQYASAIASSTAEVNAVNEYQNIMTGIGLAGSVVAGTAVGAKIGSASGPIGMIAGAVIGASVAVANRAVSTWNANRILNYKQAINATTSAYQLGVLGDATYGRSRQSIG